MASNVATSKRPLPSNSMASSSSAAMDDQQNEVSSRKKAKLDDFLDISASVIDEMDELEQDELMAATDMPHPPTNGVTQRNNDSGARGEWLRPLPPPIDPTKDAISFQQIDIDHYIGVYNNDY